MIIKSADDKQSQLDHLQSLLSRSDVCAEVKKRIDQEIRNIRAGIKGERESAYEIEFHYSKTRNWMIIHDLRLVCDGRIAQIDHLAINRVLDIWVCESKHFSEGIAINEHGECSAFFGGKAYGVPSPFEQNRKHIAVLRSLFDTGTVNLPSRLGIKISPAFHSLILVSKGARISRPKQPIDGLDTIIKNDQFSDRIDREIKGDNNFLGLAKVIAQDTLENFARSIAALHQPIEFNWEAKFGLANTLPPEPIETTVSAPESAQPESSVLGAEPKSKLVCHSCDTIVPYNVARFCWFNKPRFGGKVYCKECQSRIRS